jgi:hypothetical protein
MHCNLLALILEPRDLRSRERPRRRNRDVTCVLFQHISPNITTKLRVIGDSINPSPSLWEQTPDD